MSETSSDPSPDAAVTLREVTAATVRAICNLKVAENQNGFVAPNAISIAQAYFHPQAWFRAVYADETPVGFVMLRDDPEEPDYYLWRFMIDEAHQGNGYGKQAILALVEYVKTRPGAKELRVSYVPGEGSPEMFYRKLGFEPTGKEHGGELEARLAL